MDTLRFTLKLVVGLTTLGLLSACGSEVTEHSDKVSYQTVITQKLTLTDSYPHNQTYSGTIRSANTTGVGFELAGKLNQINVDSGDTVTKGQKLAALDTVLLQAEFAQLSASLKQVEADIKLAQSNLKRTIKLKQKNYVSEQQLDETEQQVASLLANQQRLQASLHATNLKLDKSTLLAPFSGKISQKHHNLGEVIALGSPVFTLIGHGQQLAYIGVPIDVAQDLVNGQIVDITVAKQHYQGQIAGISAEVNPVSRTVQLRISLPKDANTINGEIAYLALQQQISAEGFWVPIEALTDGVRGLWNVYTLVNDEQDNSEIQRRDVEIIYTNEQQAYIKGAIKNGDTIITQGLHKLVVGQRVIPADAEVARSL
ncbi:efflux RND transporter periplasmic adaptor subunit [Shewanella sp.]|uniref:efflux RND transporter periplasmic adaptor subunit n=1 Tax=Shewanella sp. TaxID=50422 RepID=UPI0040544921